MLDMEIPKIILVNEIVSSNDPVSTSVIKKTRNRPISPPIKLNIEDSNKNCSNIK